MMKEFIQSINRYLQGKATPGEIHFLEKYYDHFDKGENITDRLSPTEKQALSNELLTAIRQKTTERIVVPFHRRTAFRVAAAVLVLMTGAFFLLQNKISEKKATGTQNKTNAVAIVPGSNKAVLTLADNSTIILDNTANGTISSQGNTKLEKSDGQLVYTASGRSSKLLYNTITIPRGGQYQLTLSDGTKVWLNAESSLKFPAAFTGNERKVELTGEAYFEVAKNPAQPFRVDVTGAGLVEVLGTHFNVNAYAEEKYSKITLLEGSVKFSTAAASNLLKPGQQARVSNGKVKMINAVDLEEVVAWKNGKFLFDRSDVQTTMRQIARWYDVDIEYKGIPEGFFKGTMSRYESISKVLKMLELTGEVHFTLEGRKVVVTP